MVIGVEVEEASSLPPRRATPRHAASRRAAPRHTPRRDVQATYTVSDSGGGGGGGGLTGGLTAAATTAATTAATGLGATASDTCFF